MNYYKGKPFVVPSNTRTFGVPYVIPPTKESIRRMNDRIHWQKKAEELKKEKHEADPEIESKKLDDEYLLFIRGF